MVQVAKRAYTVSDYYQLLETGTLIEGDRLELIDGEIIEMSPIGSRHAACVGHLTEELVQQSHGEWTVWVQNPVRFNEVTELVPDIALLKRRPDFYAERHPTPADILLIIEVADTSMKHDRDTKIPLYARAGIREVWLIDLSRREIMIYVQPVNGVYKGITTVRLGEIAVAQTLPHLRLEVETLF